MRQVVRASQTDLSRDWPRRLEAAQETRAFRLELGTPAIPLQRIIGRSTIRADTSLALKAVSTGLEFGVLQGGRDGHLRSTNILRCQISTPPSWRTLEAWETMVMANKVISEWCRRRDSNPHIPFEIWDFTPCAPHFATPAYVDGQYLRIRATRG